MQELQAAPEAVKRIAVISVLTSALKQAMADYEKLHLSPFTHNELHVYADYGTVVFPGVGGHVEIHETLHEGSDQFAIADRDQFFKLVKLMDGMYTTLTYMPHNERMSLQCNGMRFTVFAYDVAERIKLPGYISMLKLDPDLTARLVKALPFVIRDETRPTLEHVFYDRKLDMIGASDGRQLYIEHDQHIADADPADLVWVSRDVLRRAGKGDALELGEGFACLLRKQGVYVFTQAMTENAFGFKNMHSVHKRGWQYTRFVVRAKTMLGPLQRYLRVASRLDAVVWLAVNDTHAVLLQPPISGNAKQYLNYIAVEQPQDLAGCEGWTMPEDKIDDQGRKIPSGVEPHSGRYAVCLNADYLARALRVLGGDVVVAQKNATSPIVLRNDANPYTWCNIMPIHVDAPGSKAKSATAAAWAVLDAEVPHGDF